MTFEVLENGPGKIVSEILPRSATPCSSGQQGHSVGGPKVVDGEVRRPGGHRHGQRTRIQVLSSLLAVAFFCGSKECPRLVASTATRQYALLVIAKGSWRFDAVLYNGTYTSKWSK